VHDTLRAGCGLDRGDDSAQTAVSWFILFSCLILSAEVAALEKLQKHRGCNSLFPWLLPRAFDLDGQRGLGCHRTRGALVVR